jgi:glycosyltransferase involved in cell wall biosynthesis
VVAAKKALDDGHDIVLRVVGDGAELDETKNLADRLGAPVEFHPPVPHAQMDEHYQWCDASLVHLRDWPPLQSTIPSKLIESMARGVPVIAATDGEPRSIVSQATAGESVAAMDSVELARLLGHWAESGVPRSTAMPPGRGSRSTRTRGSTEIS